MGEQLSDRELERILRVQRAQLRRGFSRVEEYYVIEAAQSAIVAWTTKAPLNVRCDTDATVRWLTPRAVHAMIDLIRRDGKSESLTADFADTTHETTLALDDVENRIDADYFLGRLARISFEQFVAVMCHEMYGFPFAIIAHQLSCTETNARQHHVRGMKNLRRIAGYPPS